MSEGSSRRDFLTVSAGVVIATGCGNMDGGGGGSTDPNAVPPTFPESTRASQSPMPGTDPNLCGSNAGMMIGPAEGALGLNQVLSLGDKAKLLWIGRDSQGVVSAMNITCTHAGCIPAYNPDFALWVCPCHGSEYSPSGVRIAGPAPRSMTRYPVCKGSDGLFRIDLTRPY